MSLALLLFAALLPVAILLIYTLWVDRLRPEPSGQLAKGFLFGIFSAFAALLFAAIFEWIGLAVEAGPEDPLTVHMQHAFFGAAIPEESAKLLFLWLLLRRNPHFDERLDGIVYAVCVGMGFAAFENILYLFNNSDSLLETALIRGLLPVPGHFCDAVVMGYFLARGCYGEMSPGRAVLGFWVLPIVLHGVYDTGVSAAANHVGGSGLVTFFTVFVFLFVFFAVNWSAQSMKRLLLADSQRLDPPCN